MARNAFEVVTAKRNSVDAEIARVLNLEGRRVQKRIVEKHLGGSKTTNTRLRGRSGQLESSVVVQNATTKAGVTETVVRIQKEYAGVHFGKKGETTVIRPKSSRALTIPTKFAQDAQGEVLGEPDGPRFKNTFIANGFIFGQVGSGGPFVPLFKLASQVRVPVRIDIQENILRPFLKPLEAKLARVLRNF